MHDKDQEQLEAKARELRNAYYKEWRKRNPEKVKANNRNYWLRKAAEQKEVE